MRQGAQDGGHQTVSSSEKNPTDEHEDEEWAEVEGGMRAKLARGRMRVCRETETMK